MSPTSHRGFPTLNAVRAAGALMVLVTHVAFNTGQVTHGWTGRRDVPAGLRRHALLHPQRLPAESPVLPRSRDRSPTAVGAALLLEASAANTAAVLGGGRGRAAVRPGERRRLRVGVVHGPDAHPGLPGRAALEQLDPDVEPVRRGRVLPGAAGARLGLRAVASSGSPASRSGSERSRCSACAWQAWAATVSDGSHHQAQWLFGFLPWFCVGMFLAAASAGAQDRAVHRRLEALGHDLTGCWILATAPSSPWRAPRSPGPRTLIPPTALESALKCVLYTIAGACLRAAPGVRAGAGRSDPRLLVQTRPVRTGRDLLRHLRHPHVRAGQRHAGARASRSSPGSSCWCWCSCWSPPCCWPPSRSTASSADS